MHNPLLTKNFTVGATAVVKRRIVKLSADYTVIPAAAATDLMIGVAAELDGAIGARVDVHLIGLADVEYGGNVTRGAFLTTDSVGRAVVANSGERIIGIAMLAGVSGDIGSALLLPAASTGDPNDALLASNNLDDLDDAATARGNLGVDKVWLPARIESLVGADANVYRVLAPVDGSITAIRTALNGALTTGNATLTAAIAGTPVTNGVVTIAQAGSAAGDVDLATPTAANAVTAGQVITLTVGGTNDAEVGAEALVQITY